MFPFLLLGMAPQSLLHPPEFDGPVTVALYQGPATGQQPSILVEVEGRRVLARLDLGEGVTRIGERLARQAALPIRSGGRTRTTRIPQIMVGEAAITGLRAEVVPGDGMVLGLGTMQMNVRITGDSGTVTLSSGGPPAQALGGWWEHGVRVSSLGPSRTVPARLGERTGRVVIGTTSETMIDGVGMLTVQGTLLGSITRPDGRTRHPDSDVFGTVGWDLLAGHDLSADGIHRAGTWRVHDPSDLAVDLLREQVGMLPELPDQSVAEGSGGSPGLASRVSQLARGLWAAGETEEALAFFEQAALYAGDRCLPWLQLAERQRAVGVPATTNGEMLYATWEALSREERDQVRRGAVLAGTLSVPQDPRCADEGPGVWQRAAVSAHSGRFGPALRVVETTPIRSLSALMEALEIAAMAGVEDEVLQRLVDREPDNPFVQALAIRLGLQGTLEHLAARYSHDPAFELAVALASGSRPQPLLMADRWTVQLISDQLRGETGERAYVERSKRHPQWTARGAWLRKKAVETGVFTEPLPPPPEER